MTVATHEGRVAPALVFAPEKRDVNTICAMAATSRAKVAEMWEVLARVHGSTCAALEQDMLPKAGIPLGWYQVLASLRRAPDWMMRFQDLARVSGISESGASRRLEQMVRAGLIDRKLCASDRRGVYAHLTSKGESTFEKAHAVFLASLDRTLGRRLDAPDAAAVQAALAKLV